MEPQAAERTVDVTAKELRAYRVTNEAGVPHVLLTNQHNFLYNRSPSRVDGIRTLLYLGDEFFERKGETYIVHSSAAFAQGTQVMIGRDNLVPSELEPPMSGIQTITDLVQLPLNRLGNILRALAEQSKTHEAQLSELPTPYDGLITYLQGEQERITELLGKAQKNQKLHQSNGVPAPTIADLDILLQP